MQGNEYEQVRSRLRTLPVIDTTATPPKPDLTVVITGNHITAIGRAGRLRVPSRADGIRFSTPSLIKQTIDKGHKKEY
jgi:hypothetical protein